MRKRFLCLLFAAGLVLSLAACGGSGGDYSGAMSNEISTSDTGFMSSSDYYDGMSKGSGEYDVYESDDVDIDRESTDAFLASRKLVYTSYISAETKEYDAFVAWLSSQVDGLAGYIESMSEDQNTHHVSGYSMPYYDPDGLGYGRDYYQTRYSNFTIRVPAGNLDKFLDLIGGNCNVVSKSTDSDDVTLNYIDVQGRISGLEQQVAKLEELSAKADNLSDLITLESRLSEVRAELESCQSKLRTFDNQINFATVNLNISEVIEFTENQGLPEGYFGQLWAAFRHGLQEFRYSLILFTFWLAENIVSLVFWVFVIVVILKLRRKFKTKGFRRFGHRKSAGSVYEYETVDPVNSGSFGSAGMPESGDDSSADSGSDEA